LNYAHSFEAYDENGELAGGLYGISVGKIFCGESMFFRISGASKFAFVKMVEFLQARGVVLIDTQMVTNATAAFGAKLISRSDYLKLLEQYGGEPLDFGVTL
jgi:leucyl/phenylalanyl-tRNA--protein transferase